MYYPEHRDEARLSRVAADRYAVRVALAERRAAEKRIRRERKVASRLRAAVARLA